MVKPQDKILCGYLTNYPSFLDGNAHVHALEAHKQYHSAIHTNLMLESAGLCLSTEHPYIEGSPDAFVMCDCYEKGV